MPRSGWLQNLAIGVIVVLVVLGSIAFGRFTSRGKDHSNPDQKYSNAPPEDRRIGNPRFYEPSCEIPQSEDEADVCAQREMAAAAWEMVRTSWYQFGAGIFGLGLVWLTFRETRKANEITRQTAISDGQAYIQAETIEVDWLDGTDPKVIVAVRNSGQTPARWYGYRCCAMKSENPSTPFNRTTINSLPLTKWYGFGANRELTFSIHDPDTVQTIRFANREEKSVRIDGVIEYETFFGDIFISEFSFAGRVWPQQFRLTQLAAMADRTQQP